jgi:hypothetical protein
MAVSFASDIRLLFRESPEIDLSLANNVSEPKTLLCQKVTRTIRMTGPCSLGCLLQSHILPKTGEATTS